MYEVRISVGLDGSHIGGFCTAIINLCYLGFHAKQVISATVAHFSRKLAMNLHMNDATFVIILYYSALLFFLSDCSKHK